MDYESLVITLRARQSPGPLTEISYDTDLTYPREEDCFNVNQYIEAFIQLLCHIDLLSRSGWRQQLPPLKERTASEVGRSLYSLPAPASLQESTVRGFDLHQSAKLACLLIIHQSLSDPDAPSKAGDDNMAEVDTILRSVGICAENSIGTPAYSRLAGTHKWRSD
jgi:hypothetical protein